MTRWERLRSSYSLFSALWSSAGLVNLSADLTESLCQNQLLRRYPSPDRALEIVVFVRNCGATTAFSTQAAVQCLLRAVRERRLSTSRCVSRHGEPSKVPSTSRRRARPQRAHPKIPRCLALKRGLRWFRPCGSRARRDRRGRGRFLRLRRSGAGRSSP
jgi:hypothetical protein